MTINPLLARISAFCSGFFLLLIGAIFITNWVNQTIGISLSIGALHPYDDVGVFAGYIIASATQLAIVLYFGVAFSRFILRVMPPPPSGTLRPTVLLLTTPATIFCFLFSAALLASSQHATWAQQVGLSPLTIAIYSLAFLTWWGGVIFPLFGRRLKQRSYLNRPFVFFLRRFSSFSDRVVLNQILRKMPSEKSVVFLVPINSRAGDWNPFLVGFAGMKLLHPFRSIPVILGSPNNDWKQAAEFLMLRAQIVVVDISERSDSIKEELEMISQHDCWAKTILLKDTTASTTYKVEQYIGSKDAQIIYYRKSWLRSLPRMILGSFTVVGFLLIFGLLASLLSLLNPVLIRPCLIFGLLTWIWSYCSLFVRPSIDHASNSSFTEMLQRDGRNVSDSSERGHEAAALRHVRPPVVLLAQILLLLFGVLFLGFSVIGLVSWVPGTQFSIADLLISTALVILFVAVPFVAFWGLAKRRRYGRWLGAISLIVIWIPTVLMASIVMAVTLMKDWSLPLFESVVVISVMVLFHALFIGPAFYLIRGKRVREFFRPVSARSVVVPT